MNDHADLPAVANASTMPAPYDFAPRDLKEALMLADSLAASTMVPKDYVGKPGNVLVAMQFGFELGLKPLQAMQSLCVINGRPSLFGDAGKALLLSKGCKIEERDQAKVKELNEASCTITVPGRQPVTRTFSKADAERAKLTNKDGPWKEYPERQMAWRAFWFAARDSASDILKGVHGAEEARDIPGEVELNPRPPVEQPRSKAAAAKADAVDVDPDTGETDAPQRTEPPEPPAHGDAPAAPESMKGLIKAKCASTNASLEALLKAHNATLETLTVPQGNAILKSLRG